MAFTRYFVSATAVLAVVAAVPSEDAAHVFKRVALLERQVTCPAGFIPACPVGIPCVPPGAVCCDDGITYVNPPDVCPAGTKPVATASNQGQETVTPTPTPAPSASSEPAPTISVTTPATSEAAPSTVVAPTNSVLPTGGTAPGGNGTYPAPSYVPVSGGALLEVGYGLVMGIAALAFL